MRVHIAEYSKSKYVYKNLNHYSKKYLLNGGSWSCDGCTYENHDDLSMCEICNTAKPVARAQPAVARAQPAVARAQPAAARAQPAAARAQPAAARSKPFYIYTTGIADWNKPEKIIDKWIRYVCDNVLKQIPVRFNEIHIIHSDILDTPVGQKHSDAVRRNIIDTLNRILCQQDMQKPRVRSSIFTDNALDFSSLRAPHIVIDMAHLFEYTEIGKATLAGIPYEIHAIFVGYYGEDVMQQIKRDNPMYSLKIASTMQLFRVLDDDTIETYIDRLIKLKYKFDKHTPSDFFYELLKSYRKNIINDIRPQFRLVTPADEKIIDEVLCNTTLPTLMTKIMNDDINYDKLYYQLLQETMIMIRSMIYQ